MSALGHEQNGRKLFSPISALKLRWKAKTGGCSSRFKTAVLKRIVDSTLLADDLVSVACFVDSVKHYPWKAKTGGWFVTI